MQNKIKMKKLIHHIKSMILKKHETLKKKQLNRATKLSLV